MYSFESYSEEIEENSQQEFFEVDWSNVADRHFKNEFLVPQQWSAKSGHGSVNECLVPQLWPEHLVSDELGGHINVTSCKIEDQFGFNVPGHQSISIEQNHQFSQQSNKISDETLKNISMKKLLQQFKGYDEKFILALKKRRRTLKNEVYARISRDKKAKSLMNAIEQCKILSKQLHDAKKTIAVLNNELEFYRSSYEKSHEPTNFYPDQTTDQHISLGVELIDYNQNFDTSGYYQNSLQESLVCCNFELNETDSKHSSDVNYSSSNDSWF